MGPPRESAVLPSFHSDPLGDAEPGLDAGWGGMHISMGTHGRELLEAPVMGFQGGGSMKTLGGMGQINWKALSNCKITFMF